jgi:hypothetical protein
MTHGSVGARNVPGDVEHLGLQLLQLVKLKFTLFFYNRLQIAKKSTSHCHEERDIIFPD